MKDFLQNVRNIFPFSFSFSIENEKNEQTLFAPPPLPPILEGSSAASPLKIWDVMPPYLKTLFEQKTEKKPLLPCAAYMQRSAKI